MKTPFKSKPDKLDARNLLQKFYKMLLCKIFFN